MMNEYPYGYLMNRGVFMILGYFRTMPARSEQLPCEQCQLGWLGLPEAVGIGPSLPSAPAVCSWMMGRRGHVSNHSYIQIWKRMSVPCSCCTCYGLGEQRNGFCLHQDLQAELCKACQGHLIHAHFQKQAKTSY